MSVWFRQGDRGERRTEWPQRPLSEVLLELTKRGYNEVDLSSAESSLQSVAVRSTVDLIASLGSELPVDVFLGQGADRTKLRMPEHLEDPDGSGYGLADWCYRALYSWLLRGNLYGDTLERGPGDVLRQVDLFHPDKVHPTIDSDGLITWHVQGQEIPEDRMLHRRVNPVPGTLLGLSPIAMHAWTIGLSLTTTRFGLQWFQDGGHPSGMLTNSEESINKERANTAKERFLSALRGNREPVVMGKGWKFEAIQINPEESQFLETQGFAAAECARIFGPGFAEILGYAAKGGSLTYANVVDRDLHVLKYGLNKWLRRLERLLSQFLPRPQYVKINRDALLETNTLQRYQAHSLALRDKWKVPNEVRDKEELPRVSWGDVPITDALEPEPDETAPDAQAEPAAEDDATTARNLTEMVQKVYLGVGKVVTAPEARALLNRAGAGLPEDFTPEPEEPDAPAEPEDEE